MIGEGGSAWRRWTPLVLLLAALALFFILGGHRYVSIDALRDHRAQLAAWSAVNPVLAGLVCIAISAVLMAMAFPSIGIVMAAAGLLLGLWGGFILCLIGATLGGVVFFLAARGARKNLLSSRVGGLLRRLQTGAERNGFFYLLSLRLMPIFPTATVTLAAAAADMRLRDFVPATFLGAAPASFIFTSIGAGAGGVLDRGENLDLIGALLKPEIFLPLLALTLLALATAWWKGRSPRDETGAG